MYSSRGNNNTYGQEQQQQPKPGSYATHLGPDGVSQIPLASRHHALLGGHSSSGPHYAGQYTSVYGSSALNSGLHVPPTSVKGAGSSVFEGRSGYGSPKYTSENYPAANQKYVPKGEKIFSDDRLPYAERSSAYSGRDLQTESTVRLTDSLSFGRQHQTDIYDRLDAASALRKELLDGSSRQGDYLAARAATVRQELLPYGTRMDTADLHTLSMISGTQHPPSILGAAPRREMEDLVYTHTSANPGYGVSLPPGRAYASGKSLHGTSLDSDYPGGILAHAGYARLDDSKDGVEYAREIERREEDRRREILRDRERDRERDRDRERERQRERERERDRERERERERERRRERERDLERREKERDREAKRGSEIRRDRSPLRSSRDRGRSSSVKARRSVRRESPVKEKRREYACKVYSSNLVDPERDYLSMDKRYPRLYVSPECSKVVINWSKEDLKVPFNTPISFEHDFVQEETPSEHDSASKKMIDGHAKLESGATRWNAKVLLMSGLSQNAWEELSSERKYEDRIPHLCNMLRFAFLKDGSSCMAIGGSWDTMDGTDPAVDKSTLVQTVLRYAKELTGLDLKNCRHWNPFLEIHYDRVGKDGLFSHKEVTVLYIPDLSDCLPSIDAWRDQWLAHKKAIAERERLHALKREKLREKKEVPKDKEIKDLKNPEKKKEGGSASKVNGKEVEAKEVGKEGVKSVIEKKDGDITVVEKKDGNKTVIEKKDETETVDEGNNYGKKNLIDNTDVQSPGSGKKKIIRKVIKKEVAAEKDGAENTEVIGEAAEPCTTPTKKNATQKAPVVKTVKKEDEVKESESSDVKEKNEDVIGASVKTTAKKKIIKKVVKKKIATKDVNNKDKVAKENERGSTIGEQTASEVKLEKNESVSEALPLSVVPEQRKDVGGSSGVCNTSEKVQVKEEKKAKVEGGGSDKNAKSKNVKEKKDKDVKTETMVKDVKDKKKTENPPRHPGLFLQTKGSKYSKLRSLSLSLDSLLDYTDKDIEESTFELSVFSETFYEMLQYQMGSRILKFLQKLRIKFVTKRNQKKRQREEVSNKKEKEKTSSKKSSPKRQKTEDVTLESRSVKTETLQEGSPVDDKTVVKDEKMVIDNVENSKPEDESKKDEDPEEEEEEEEEEIVEEEEEEEEEVEEEEEEEVEEEEVEEEEDPEEDENMADANPRNDAEEVKPEVEKVNMDVKSENIDEKVKDEQEEKAKVTVDLVIKSEDEKKEKKENPKVDTKKKETPLDKQLLQAFRFFDRNRVGYIRVEDLRLILHALGNCMSHRDAKELVQSALLESNTGRDDRILYTKLVKMTDI